MGAWNVTKGDSSQIIALIDTGVDGDHPDIDSKIAGGSFAAPLTRFDTDLGNHGISVAGILAAETNNGIGIAGINWAAKLFVGAIRTNGPESAFNSDIASMVQQVSNSGAKQLNMSIGTDKALTLSTLDALENAWKMDISIVASKGNDGNSNSNYPSDYDFVVGVSAVEKDGSLRIDSNWGNGVKLATQGRDIKTLSDGGGYRDFQQTSGATPMVTAAISLVRAANPSLTADEAEEILYLTATDNTTTGVGYDDKTGWGTPNVAAAVAYATERFFSRPDESFDSFTKILDNQTWSMLSGDGLAAGLYLLVDVWEAKKYIDFSEYGFTSPPDVIARMRSISGYSGDKPTHGGPYMFIDSSTLTTEGVWVKTFAFFVGYDVSGSAVNKWFPSDLSDHSSPTIRLATTIAGVPGLSAPTSLSTESYSNFQQRTRISWLDGNFFETGWVVERRLSGVTVWNIIATLPGNTSGSIIYEDFSTAGSATYEYRVKPIGVPNFDDLYSPIATVATPPRWPESMDVSVTAILGSCISGLQGGGGSGSLQFGGESFGLGGGTTQSLGGPPGEAEPNLLEFTDQIITTWDPPGNQAVPIDHYKIMRVDGVDGGGNEYGLVIDNIQILTDTLCNNLNNTFYPLKIWAIDNNGNTSLSFKAPSVKTGCLDICIQNPGARIGFRAESTLPTTTELLGNYPNPFNPTTVIAYRLPATAKVSVSIYNLLGQIVRTYYQGEQSAGEHRVTWDSRDENGQNVASGMYFYKLVAGDFIATRKMVLLK